MVKYFVLFAINKKDNSVKTIIPVQVLATLRRHEACRDFQWEVPNQASRIYLSGSWKYIRMHCFPIATCHQSGGLEFLSLSSKPILLPWTTEKKRAAKLAVGNGWTHNTLIFICLCVKWFAAVGQLTDLIKEKARCGQRKKGGGLLPLLFNNRQKSIHASYTVCFMMCFIRFGIVVWLRLHPICTWYL